MTDSFSQLAAAADLPNLAVFYRLLAEFSGEVEDAETAREGLEAIEVGLETGEG